MIKNTRETITRNYCFYESTTLVNRLLPHNNAHFIVRDNIHNITLLLWPVVAIRRRNKAFFILKCLPKRLKRRLSENVNIFKLFYNKM